MKRTRSALLKWMARSLVRLIPMGEAAVDFTTDVLPTMSQEVYGWWTGQVDPEDRRKELEELVQADRLEVQSAVEAAIEDAAGDGPIDPGKRDQIKRYLEQVPDAIRRSMRRPEDSRGRTVPPHLAPRSATDLASLLPGRAPRFHAGDRPIPGADIELISLLGAGGFGEVWRARKTHIDQDVALKFCLDPDALTSLRNETALLRRLMSGDAMHPGIVRLIGTYNDCSLLEYEFVEGSDLAGLIREWHADGKVPTPAQVLSAIREITEIVAFAHQLEPPLVHRDLKPANILVQRKRGGELRFRLTDFGIGGIASARQVAATMHGNATANASTSIQGSYSFLYASPQQMRAERPDPTDDVYSLGVIFWQMANGDLTDGAPGGTSWMEDLKAAGYPASVVSAIARCFDHRAERRHKSAASLLEALKEAPPPMPGPRPAERQGPAPHQPPPEPRPMPIQPLVPRPAPPPRRRSPVPILLTIGAGVLVLISCVIGGIVIATLSRSEPNWADEPAVQSTGDPRLQGWQTQEGDSFVTSTFGPDGAPVVVVANRGAHYVIHQDGTRKPVFFNQFTNMWQDAQ